MLKQLITTKKQANAIAGTLGKPSKMPGMSYGLPANEGGFVEAICFDKGWNIPDQYGCQIGKLLSKLSGTVCSKCYADERANYGYPSVQIAQTKRLVGLSDPMWTNAMVYLIDHQFDKLFSEALTDWIDYSFCNGLDWTIQHCERLANHDVAFFRWHDSGDIIDHKHLEKIALVASLTPYLSHWLPTRETKLVQTFNGIVPSNLLIRHSAHRVDKSIASKVLHCSSVSLNKPSIGVDCSAPLNFNECGDCRRCWSHDVKEITYPQH